MDTKALRRKILDLAIRGQLVPQDPADEPASVLLDRIRAEKQKMVKEGKLKAKDIKNDSIIFVGEDSLHYEKFADGSVKCIEDEIPFDLPDGWAWSRFGCVVTLMSGTTYPAENELLSGDRLYVKVGDMNLPGNEREIVTSSRYLDEYNPSHLVPINSVIFPKRGGAIATNKKKLVLQKEILIDLNTMAFTPVSPVNLMYCYYWFLSIDLGKINSGSSVPQINNKDIEPLLFPIPPISEQEKIIQAITPLLDAEQRISSAGAEISRLVSCAKSEILDLAIRGQLVPQDPNDEPASVLLERIRAEKEELIKQGKIKRDNKESVIFRGEDNSYYLRTGKLVESLEDWRFDALPETWELCCLGDVCDYGDCINVDTADIADDAWILDLEDIEKDTGAVIKKVTKAQRSSASTKHRFYSGQVLYSKLRPYLNKVVLSDADGYCTSEIIPLKFDRCVLPEYARYYLMSPTFLAYADRCSYGVKMPRMGTADGKKAIIPLPPLVEQKRIAKTIELLFSQLTRISEALV